MNELPIGVDNFKDIGEPISEPDYKPSTVQKDPEKYLTKKFLRAGADYGGKLAPEGFALSAMLR